MGNKTTLLAFIFLLSLLMFSAESEAAVISGKVYDLSLSLVKDAVVEIDTEPRQKIVSKDGFYSFNVPLGRYKITARTAELETTENITVKTEGNYTLDLILFPSLEEEEDLISTAQEIEKDRIEEFSFEEKNMSTLLYLASLFLILTAYVLFVKRKKLAHFFSKKKQDDESREDKHIREIIHILKEEGHHTTQKEIRRRIPLSEAKISLLLAELEEEGRIKRFKKGRANIVVLKNKR